LPREQLQKPLVAEPLGRDVQQPRSACAQIIVRAEGLVAVQARIEPGCRNAMFGQKVDLVLHQRDQRRDDDRQAVEHHRGQLVAQAFAAAGGEDSQRGAAVQQS
jgi:hypothetical protein